MNYLLPGTRITLKSQLSNFLSRLISWDKYILTFAKYPSIIMVSLQEILSHFSLIKLITEMGTKIQF